MERKIRPPTDHLLTTNRPPTNHLPTNYRPPTDHLPTTYRPPTDHQPNTYSTDHLPTTNRPPTDHLPTTYQTPTKHLLTTYQPPPSTDLLKGSNEKVCKMMTSHFRLPKSSDRETFQNLNLFFFWVTCRLTHLQIVAFQGASFRELVEFCYAIGCHPRKPQQR